jgi:hypothetical protein
VCYQLYGNGTCHWCVTVQSVDERAADQGRIPATAEGKQNNVTVASVSTFIAVVHTHVRSGRLMGEDHFLNVGIYGRIVLIQQNAFNPTHTVWDRW